MHSPTSMGKLESKKPPIITPRSLTFSIMLRSEWPIMMASKSYKFQRMMLSKFQEEGSSSHIGSTIPKPKIEMF